MIKRLAHLPISIYLGLMIALATALRLWDISKASVWHDEGFTFMISQMSLHDIIARTARDVHPPLYYLLLHGWMAVFGTNEVAGRGFSAACTIAIIPIAYVLIRKLWSEPAARLTALFIAAGPYLIRYGQEARMYGMLALIVVAATYALVRARERNQWEWWAGYGLLITAGLYTHYYTVFIIIAHWLFVISRRPLRTNALNPRWLAANALAVVLFLPWVPTVIKQVSRVQGGFWIPPVHKTTLPGTVFHFLVAGVPDKLQSGWILFLGAAFIAMLATIYIYAGKRRPSITLLTLYCLTGPLLVFALSLHRPIYVDRYFVFASVAFYALLAIGVTMTPRRVHIAATVVLLLTFSVGVDVVHRGYTHRMRDVGTYVNSRYATGDYILSGELYTYFDFSYYNHTGAPVHLWSKQDVDGYGESSLIYDRSASIVVHDLASVQPQSGHLWVVGKPGVKAYYTDIPANWRPIGPKFEASDSAVQEYLVLPRDSGPIAVQ